MKLIDCRGENGMSVRQFSFNIGVDRSAVSRIISRHRKPSLEVAAVIKWYTQGK
jgi:hypothetical protein